MEALLENFSLQSLWGEIHELILAINTIVQSDINFPPGHSRMHRQGHDVPRSQLLDLILHERNQWANDERQPVQYKPRDLKADRLPSSCGQQRKDIFSLQDSLHNLALQGSEMIVAPVFLQYGFRRCQRISEVGVLPLQHALVQKCIDALSAIIAAACFCILVGGKVQGVFKFLVLHFIDHSLSQRDRLSGSF